MGVGEILAGGAVLAAAGGTAYYVGQKQSSGTDSESETGSGSDIQKVVGEVAKTAEAAASGGVESITVSAPGDGGSGGSSSAGSKINQAVDELKNTTDELKNQAGGTAGDVGEAVDKGRETVEDAGDAAKDVVNNATDAAGSMGGSAGGNPVDTFFNNAVNKSEEYSKDVGKIAANTVVKPFEGAAEVGADAVPEQIDENTLKENVNAAYKTVLPDEVVEQNLQSNLSDARSAVNKGVNSVKDALFNNEPGVLR